MAAPGAAHPLARQTALVTGASRGIGRGVALALARAGADVAIAARTVPDLEDLAKKIEALGRRAIVVPADVRDDRSVEGMVSGTLDAFGRLDILVNNAGLGHFGPVDEMAIEQIDEMLGVNLRGPMLCTRAVVPAMKRQGSGNILNIASVAGLVGEPEPGGLQRHQVRAHGLQRGLHARAAALRHPGRRDLPRLDRHRVRAAGASPRAASPSTTSRTRRSPSSPPRRTRSSRRSTCGRCTLRSAADRRRAR